MISFIELINKYMNKTNKYTKRSGETLSLNDDRGDAIWQIERGKRYGNSRKARAKAKHLLRRKKRREENKKID